MKHKSYQLHILIAVIYFLVAALLGLLLRSYPIFTFDFNYRFVVHAHSHLALLGWVYVVLTTLLHYCFVDKDASSRRYKRIFWCTQATLVGMLVTFPFQGYALFSIIFSTLFLIVSYVYVYHFLKNINPKYRHSKGLQCAKAALTYMVISSLGPWALGAIMNTLGAQSIWYRLAIFFYLHFQYNGWMILALVGLFFYVWEQRGLEIPQKTFARFFLSLNLGIVFSFFLSTLWTKPASWLYVMAGLGAVAQFYAFVLLWGMFKNKIAKLSFSKVQHLYLRSIVILGLIKMVLQLLSVLPYFANMTVNYIDFTIGYLHLTFLGVVSIGLFLFMDYFSLFRVSKKSYLWYFLGFLFTEALIFYRGIAAWQQWKIFSNHLEVLALFTLLIPLGLVIMLIENRTQA